MKALLLCGYRSSDHNEDPLGLTRDASGLTLIERRIRHLTAMGMEVVSVLAGGTADEQLRQCPAIARTELVFDTNEPADVTVGTNVKSGLAALEDEPCFVLPVEVPPPAGEVWTFVREGYRREAFNKFYVVQALTAQGAPLHFGFPLLITRHGNREIRQLPGLKSLADTRLKYLHLIYPQEANLASTPKPA